MAGVHQHGWKAKFSKPLQPVIPLSVEPDAPQNEETDDIGQLNAFFDTLDCEPETTDRFMITDEDGEDAFIRIGSIAMVRVALDVL